MSAMSELNAQYVYALEMAEEASNEAIKAFWWRKAREIVEMSM
jgi:hypothetical protein